jgi:hypothetical protein
MPVRDLALALLALADAIDVANVSGGVFKTVNIRDDEIDRTCLIYVASSDDVIFDETHGVALKID